MNRSYLLGCAIIDNAHTVLVDSMEGLCKKLATRSVSLEDLRDLYDRLTWYVDVHFSQEEDIMRRVAFPLLEEHHQSHLRFVRRLNDLKSLGLQENVRYKALDTLLALNSWFLRHILKEDASLVQYVKDHNPELCLEK